MCEGCGIQLFQCEAVDDSIERSAMEAEFPSISGQTFAVEVINVGESSGMRSDLLERNLGAVIRRRLPEARVSLSHPDIRFLGILSGGIFSLGILKHRRRPGAIRDRMPRMRPIVHPSTIQPKIARCMVNLTRVPTGSWLIDPFCGVGGILVEAEAIGCRAVGTDIKLRMVRGCARNLSYSGSPLVGAVHADARYLPFAAPRHVATDPPYGKSTSLVGGRMGQIMRDFLHNLSSILDGNAFVVVAGPVKELIEAAAEENDYAVREHFSLRVHKSLTRHIYVLTSSS